MSECRLCTAEVTGNHADQSLCGDCYEKITETAIDEVEE